MTFKTNLIGGFLGGLLLVSTAMLSGSASAQEKRGGGQQKSQSRSASPQRKAAPQKQQQTRSNPVNRTQSRQTTTRSSTNVAVQQNRNPQRSYNQRQSTVRRSTTTRPMRMQYGSTGRGISATTWRASNPSWNGGYYFHSGAYYYDSGYSYPAIATNEWGGIAALAGGVAFVGLLADDPTLVFIGTAGALLSFDEYQIDQHSSNGEIRLRAAYFARPYFWREGVRYDRIVVTVGGSQNYQFRRH